jgi:YD repeat-containing protein
MAKLQEKLLMEFELFQAKDNKSFTLGQLTTATNERGEETTYIYDKANRLLSVRKINGVSVD